MSSDEIDRFYKALCTLAREKPQWDSNLNKYLTWDNGVKGWWIASVKRQAQEGLPMAVELITEVVRQRMLE